MLNAISCSLGLFCGVDFNQLFLFLIPFLFIIIGNELLDKKTNLPREVHRKIGHVLSGLTILTASYYLGFIEMVLFATALIIGAFGTRVLKFKSVHQVTRKSVGTVLFALVTLLLTLLWFESHPDLLRYGILILTIPDAAAAVIGSRWGTHLEKWKKSYLGSVVFFILTIAVTVFFVPLSLWWAILVIAVILTVSEFFTVWGLDNLTLPLLGSTILFFLL